MQLHGFWQILDFMQSVLTRDFTNLEYHLMRSVPGPEEVHPGARSILEAANRLHPRTEKGNRINKVVQFHADGFYGKRPTINAAGALTLLKHWECYLKADRLAIIANMCDYDFWLDTKKVDANCRSLRLAILALTLNNGDLSLLVPEAYLPQDGWYQEDVYATSPSYSTLLQNLFVEAHRIEYRQVRDSINIQLQTNHQGRFTVNGMILNSHLWSVAREIDFIPIQNEWSKIWESCKCWHVHIERQKYETSEQYHARQTAFTKRFNSAIVHTQALQDFRRFGRILDDSAVWGDLNHTGIQIEPQLDAKRIKQVPQMQEVVSRIIFSVLCYIRYTLNISEDGELIKGLATSIWQSVRIDQVPGSEHELPHEVDHTLFAHTDVVTRPFATLQLEETLEGSLAQLWFIDRIMQNERLWCGTYTPPKWPAHVTSHDGLDAEITLEEDLEAHKTIVVPKDDISIIKRQLTRQVLTSQIESFLTKEGNMSSNRHAMVTHIEAKGKGMWTDRKERIRKRTLLSTFDVDGPCLVATPYNPEWEILPRPKLRSMSVCWVVEPKEGTSGAAGSAPEMECHPLDVSNSDLANGTEAKGKDKGKRKVSDTPQEAGAPRNTGLPEWRKCWDYRDQDL